MMNPPVVSVVLPVFNGKTTIVQAIESIQNQTFRDWELIIVDDGSRDDSYFICAEQARKDIRIRLYQNDKNQGLARTMNRLVSLAKGEFIAVQEQDDRSVPDRLEKEALVLQSMPEIGIVSGVAAWVNNDDQLFAYFPGILAHGGQYPREKRDMVRYLYIEQCKVPNAACMIRRKVLEKIPGPFDPEAKISVDWQFFIHAAHTTEFWGISDVLVRMQRGNEHEHLTGKKDLQFSEARRCIKKIYSEYKNVPGSPINYWLYRKAMAEELTIEGRYYGGFAGVQKLLIGLVYSPTCKSTWVSFGETAFRFIKKFVLR